MVYLPVETSLAQFFQSDWKNSNGVSFSTVMSKILVPRVTRMSQSVYIPWAGGAINAGPITIPRMSGRFTVLVELITNPGGVTYDYFKFDVNGGIVNPPNPLLTQASNVPTPVINPAAQPISSYDIITSSIEQSENSPNINWSDISPIQIIRFNAGEGGPAPNSQSVWQFTFSRYPSVPATVRVVNTPSTRWIPLPSPGALAPPPPAYAWPGVVLGATAGATDVRITLINNVPSVFH